MSHSTRFRDRIQRTFREAVTVTPKAGENAYGEVVPGEPVLIAGRLEPMTRLLQSGQGGDVVLAGRLHVAHDAPVTVDSTVEHDGRAYVVISGGLHHDLGGTPTHQEWLLGDG